MTKGPAIKNFVKQQPFCQPPKKPWVAEKTQLLTHQRYQ